MAPIDGTTGIVVLGAVSLVMPELTGDLDAILEWADEFRRLAFALTPTTPRTLSSPRSFGAEGIGLAVPSICSSAIASRSSRPSF